MYKGNILLGGNNMERMGLDKQYYIAVFHSRNHALQLYQTLKKKGLNHFELVSTPSRLKAGCGYSIKFKDMEDYNVLNKYAELTKRAISEVYSVKREDGKRVLKKLIIT